MKNIFLYIIIGLFLISLISASQDYLGTFPQGKNITLVQTCATCTYNNVTTITYPNSTVIPINDWMTKSGSVYNYTFTQTDAQGTYLVNGIGDLDSVNTAWTYSFDVTYSGLKTDAGKSTLYIAFIGILIFVFIITLFGIRTLPSDNNRDEYGRIFSINYLKYLRPVLWLFEWMMIVAILYVSSNLAFVYMGEQLFAKLLLTFFKATFALTLVIVVIWIIWIFVSMYHDKEFQNMINRGIFPEGDKF